MSDELLLPEGSCLLHVGPYKTGSSALQAGFHGSRAELARHGVRYAGATVRPMRAGWGLIGTTPRGRRRATDEDWQGLVREVRTAAEPRVVVSTEDFGRIGPDLCRRVVDDLGADRLHVLAVVRRLDRLLPSQWQQRAQSFRTVSYEEYLRSVLGDDESDRDRRAFWASHDVAAQARRWADLLPEGRVTLLVAREGDRTLVPRTFERLLGLPEGLLEPGPRSNPSLSLNGIELLRRVNLAFAERRWSDTDYRRFVQDGLVTALKAAPRTELDLATPRLPRWAVEPVSELSRQRADAVEQAAREGVRVIGDPDALRVVDAEGAPETVTAPDAIGIEATVHALTGLVDGVVEQRRAEAGRTARRRRRLERGRTAERPQASPAPLAEVSGRGLVRELGRRVVRRARGVRA